MIYLFAGNDITHHQQQIDILLAEKGLTKYSQLEDLESAYWRCLNRSLLSEITVTIISLYARDLAKLKLDRLPLLHSSPNLLIIICVDFVRQTKIGKAFQPYLVNNASVPNNWDKRGIAQNIDFYANQLGLYLTPKVKEYLLQAVNNNFPLLHNGLKTVAILSGQPDLALIREIIPSEYANSIELKEMILRRQRAKIPDYITKLIALNKQRTILGGLSYQFTLLMQTAVAIEANLSDDQISRLAGIGNTKRIYFLRRELKQVSIPQLIWLNHQISTNRYELYNNLPYLKAKLLHMCCY